MTDLNSIVIPIAVMLILFGAISACVAFYFRFERRRAELLTAEMAGYRELAERALAQQEESRARIAELTGKVAEVERILRSVG
ncbi:hypothetical protein [Bailinhaonella thermotolerans]|uniref:Uncharacterized protein n=1 Tax=Bailinhaonella thermotolerans TaxID=1070861 RepID=A0A3A4AS78_9ACTN|nr:hypothetical protein [Bailinhaonella thermotolerans]RJL32061.1 hypothetical protein D5H75_16665 [Bailinhaonella thermotolerans]